jgi:hypothetical protein
MSPNDLLQSTGEVAESPAARLTRMLTDPSEEPITLTRGQLAYLMGTAGRWAGEAPHIEALHYMAGYDAGYRDRVREENGKPHPAPVFQMGRWYDQVEYRRRCDEQAKLPRDNDYAGGPVEAWT